MKFLRFPLQAKIPWEYATKDNESRNIADSFVIHFCGVGLRLIKFYMISFYTFLYISIFFLISLQTVLLMLLLFWGKKDDMQKERRWRTYTHSPRWYIFFSSPCYVFSWFFSILAYEESKRHRWSWKREEGKIHAVI